MKLSIQIQNINLGFLVSDFRQYLSMANVYNCSLAVADSKWNKRLSKKEKKASFKASIFFKNFSRYNNFLHANTMLTEW